MSTSQRNNSESKISQKLNKKVGFSKKTSQLEYVVKNKIGAVLMATGLGLSGSSIMYAGINNLKNIDGDGIMPAETLFTHLKGLNKIDTYDDPNTTGAHADGWQYSGSRITNNHGEDNSVLDNILGFPGNGMIFIGGILLVGAGINMSSEKKNSFLLQTKKILISGEKMTMSATGVDGSKTNFTVSLKQINQRQTQVNINGIVSDKVINTATIENTSIDKIADRLVLEVISKMI